MFRGHRTASRRPKEGNLPAGDPEQKVPPVSIFAHGHMDTHSCNAIVPPVNATMRLRSFDVFPTNATIRDQSRAVAIGRCVRFRLPPAKKTSYRGLEPPVALRRHISVSENAQPTHMLAKCKKINERPLLFCTFSLRDIRYKNETSGPLSQAERPGPYSISDNMFAISKVPHRQSRSRDGGSSPRDRLRISTARRAVLTDDEKRAAVAAECSAARR